jgi:hypothetical protein
MDNMRLVPHWKTASTFPEKNWDKVGEKNWDKKRRSRLSQCSQCSQLSLTSHEVSVHLVRLEGAPGYRSVRKRFILSLAHF